MPVYRGISLAWYVPRHTCPYRGILVFLFIVTENLTSPKYWQTWSWNSFKWSFFQLQTIEFNLKMVCLGVLGTRWIDNACTILCCNYFLLSLNKYWYFIKVYFMELLDVNEYIHAVTKLANQIVAKAPSAGNSWHMALHVLLSLVCLHCWNVYLNLSFAL